MSLAKSSILFAIGTFFSRISGLIRVSVMAKFFGASSLYDAFLIANTIPNMLREMLAEGALGSSFTKVFAEKYEHDKEMAKKLLVDSIWLISLLMFAIVLLGIILAPWIVRFLTINATRNSSEEFISQIIGLTRIIFPFIGFMSIASIAGGALHQRGRFLLSSMSSILLNGGYLLGVFAIGPAFFHWGPDWIERLLADKMMSGVAVGVLLGGVGQMSVQIWGTWKPFLKESRLIPRSFPWNDDIKKIFLLMIPMIVASSSSQINVTVNTIFKTSLAEGGIAWLDYASKIFLLPIGIIGVAIGTAVLPQLSKSIAKANKEITDEVSKKFQNALGLMFWVLGPCFVYLLVNRLEMIQLLFEHGKFDSNSSQGTSSALLAYSFGIFGFSAIKVLTPFYFALDKTKIAMKISLFSILINFVLNYYLVDHFQHMGLAITASIVGTVNASLLLIGLLLMKLRLETKKMLIHGFWLVSLMLVAYLLQKLLHGLFYSPDFIFVTPYLKLNAAIVLLVNGLAVVFLTIAVQLLGFRQHPRQLLNNLRRT